MLSRIPKTRARTSSEHRTLEQRERRDVDERVRQPDHGDQAKAPRDDSIRQERDRRAPRGTCPPRSSARAATRRGLASETPAPSTPPRMPSAESSVPNCSSPPSRTLERYSGDEHEQRTPRREPVRRSSPTSRPTRRSDTSVRPPTRVRRGCRSAASVVSHLAARAGSRTPREERADHSNVSAVISEGRHRRRRSRPPRRRSPGLRTTTRSRWSTTSRSRQSARQVSAPATEAAPPEPGETPSRRP